MQSYNQVIFIYDFLYVYFQLLRCMYGLPRWDRFPKGRLGLYALQFSTLFYS